MYLWAQEEWVPANWIRMQVGLRGDYFTYNVDDHREGGPDGLPHASGFAHQRILSPKASVVLSPWRRWDIFVNAGGGFHSNDARDVIISNSHATLPRAIGAETGLRVRPSDRISVAAAAWMLDLEREFVWVGDAGTTELSGATRRYGLDLEGRWGIRSWLSADADLNLSRGYFRDMPDSDIPLAPRITSSGGLTIVHPVGLQMGFRYVYIGDRPADEAGLITAPGYTLFTLLGSYRLGDVQLHLVLENLLDVAWNEAQFSYESRLRDEPAPAAGIHFTPGNPRNVRFGLSYLF
jgi:outer membrane receptor protein involved in Fe transport